MSVKFRTLRAEEIECRVGQRTKDKSRYSVLLYKTSRTDMDLLDETVGAENWQSEHYEVKGKDFCKIGIKVDGEWIWKSDCGAETNVEAEKGESSDAFKRAGFQWGIGRALYSAPNIWLDQSVDERTLKVEEIYYSENGTITRLTIRGKKNGTYCTVYSFGGQEVVEAFNGTPVLSKSELVQKVYELGGDVAKLLTFYKVEKLEDLSEEVLAKVVKAWEKKREEAQA